MDSKAAMQMLDLHPQNTEPKQNSNKKREEEKRRKKKNQEL